MCPLLLSPCDVQMCLAVVIANFILAEDVPAPQTDSLRRQYLPLLPLYLLFKMWFYPSKPT